MDAEAAQSNEQSNSRPSPVEPSELSTGIWSSAQNTDDGPARRWSAHKAAAEKCFPELLEYYEDRRTGRIEAIPYEEWGEDVSERRAEKLDEAETRKVRHVFFAMDYSHGFTGRGGKLALCAHDI